MDGCTGLLVTHEDGRVECLDVDGNCLEPDPLRHEWRADCGDVPGLCGCRRHDVRAADRQAA